MTQRITDKMLELQVEILNDWSKCRYRLGSSYGHVNLELCSMQTTGIRSISLGNTKAELYYQLVTLNEIHSQEQNNKVDYVKNCKHLDTFNISSFKDDEKRDMSHIRESTDLNGKFVYTCYTCHKKVSKAVAEFCQVPKTRNELRSLRFD